MSNTLELLRILNESSEIGWLPKFMSMHLIVTTLFQMIHSKFLVILMHLT